MATASGKIQEFERTPNNACEIAQGEYKYFVILRKGWSFQEREPQHIRGAHSKRAGRALDVYPCTCERCAQES